MFVSYEWDVETINAVETAELEAGECIEHYHCAKYAEAKAYVERITPEAGTKLAIVLVRDDDAGRSWAYVEDGKIPEFFMDAIGFDIAKVPKRFLAEVLAGNIMGRKV